MAPNPALPALPLFRRAVSQSHLSRTSLVSHGRATTYRELLVASARLSCEISKSDVDEDRVAFMCPPGLSYVSTMFATWATGGVAVPIHTKHPLPEIEHVLRDSEPRLVVYHERYAEIIEPIATSMNIPCLAVSDNDFEGDVSSSPEITGNVLMTDSRRALMVYTSGTTGKPKGVVSTHSGLRAMIIDLVSAWQWTPSDRIPHFLPLHHTHGILNKLLCPLWAGATVEFVSPDPKSLWQLLAEHTHRPPEDRLSLFMAVPTVYSRMLNCLHQGELVEEEQRTALEGAAILRLMVSGSAACPVPLMEEWESVTGHRLLERYGMTEIGMGLSNPVKPVKRRFPGYVGIPLPGVEARIVDEEDPREPVRFEFEKLPTSYPLITDMQADADAVPETPEAAALANIAAETAAAEAKGAAAAAGDAQSDDSFEGYVEEDNDLIQGALQIKGENVFKEYWQRPDATDKEFTADGWFRTGDIAAFNTKLKAFKICGRASVDIINTGGYKISALDVERVILSHPNVAEVAVMGVEDDEWGERVGALVVWKTGTNETQRLELDGLREWMGDRIAAYKIPSRLVYLDDLPKNTMGKVMKKQLAHFLGGPEAV